MVVDGLGVDQRASEGLAAPLACPAHSARARPARVQGRPHGAWARTVRAWGCARVQRPDGARRQRPGPRPWCARAAPALRQCSAHAAPVSSAQTAPGASVQARARGAPERRPRSASAPPVRRPCRAHAAPVQNFDISHSTFGPPWCQRGGCSAYIVGGVGRASVPPGERRPGNDGGCLGRREARDQRLGHAPRSPKLAPTRPTLRDARILSPRLEPTGQKWAVRPTRARPKNLGVFG